MTRCEFYSPLLFVSNSSNVELLFHADNGQIRKVAGFKLQWKYKGITY